MKPHVHIPAHNAYFLALANDFISQTYSPASPPSTPKAKYLCRTQHTHPRAPKRDSNANNIHNEQHSSTDHESGVEDAVQHQVSPQVACPHGRSKIDRSVEENMGSHSLCHNTQ
jgi:hypothetical protein